MAARLPALAHLELPEVVKTGRILGKGSYGEVVEVQVHGRKCAAKCLHRELLFNEFSKLSDLYDRFIDECLCHSKLKHPNIVQLIGVHFTDPEYPVPIIVMECLSMSLTDCLDRYPRLPHHMERSILLDVANGLCFLHGQKEPVMHRDLTANNVLLTPHMQAKISDLGQAKLLKRSPKNKKTMAPGNVSYMPPEACIQKPNYTTKIDIFSFGVLMLHVFTHQWPFKKEVLNPKTKQVESVTEVESRRVYLDKMERDILMKELAESCLNNDPAKRPDAVELVEELTKSSLPSPFANTLELELALEAESAKSQALKNRLKEIDLQVKAVIGDSAPDTSDILSPNESTLAEAYIQLQDIAAVNLAVLDDAGSPELIVGYKSPNQHGRSDIKLSLMDSTHKMEVTVRAPLSLHFTGTVVQTIESVKEPWGLVTGKGGTVFITSGRGYNGVLAYNRQGELIKEYVPSHYSYERVTDGKCYYPRGIDLDGENGFLLADTWCHRIQHFKLSGSDLDEAVFEKSAGSKGDQNGQFNLPQSVRVNGENGDVYICDKDNHRIQVLDRNLEFKSIHGEKEGPLNFHYPQDLAFDGQGNIYIADCGHYVIKVFDKNFEFLHKIGGKGCGKGSFEYISSLCIDKRDFLYVTDKTWNCVQVFDPAGEFVMQIQLPCVGEKGTSEPRGVTVDEDGFVYVSCSATGSVHLLK